MLREGNSDRRAPASVKSYARNHPHSMGAWTAGLARPTSRTWTADDFRSNEKSAVIDADGTLRIELVGDDGTDHRAARVGAGARRRGRRRAPSCASPRCASSSTAQIARAKAEDVLFSVHLKATMMKVSDPIIFGHVVRAFFPTLFARVRRRARRRRPQPQRRPRRASSSGLDVAARRAPRSRPPSRPGSPRARRSRWSTPTRASPTCTCPSDVIVDASMPAMIRTSGHMWGPDGEEADTLAVIPDSSYAGIYQVVIDDCRAHGAFDPATMGSVPNVGLMAQAAEEYGSHDKTFEIPAAGTVRVVDDAGDVAARARRSRRRHLARCARPRTCRSATGSSSPSPAPAPPATRPCSGSTRAAPTTPT